MYNIWASIVKLVGIHVIDECHDSSVYLHTSIYPHTLYKFGVCALVTIVIKKHLLGLPSIGQVSCSFWNLHVSTITVEF